MEHIHISMEHIHVSMEHIHVSMETSGSLSQKMYNQQQVQEIKIAWENIFM